MPARRTHTDTDDNAQLLDIIFNTTDVLMAYMDRSFNFIKVNKAYVKADKHPASYYPGRNHFDIYPDAENEKIFRRVVRTGKPYTAAARPFEYPDYNEKGITYWDWSLQPVKIKGKVTGLVLSLRDVTAQTATRISADKNQAFLDTVIEQTPHPMWISDDTGTVIRMNRALERMLKLKKEEIVGTYNVLKDAQVKKQGCLPAVKDVYRNGKMARFLIHYDTANEPQIRSAEKVFRIIDITISPILDDNGRITNAICLQKDITAQVQNEREVSRLNSFYSTILSGIREGIWVTDRRDRMIFFNRGMEKIAGVKAGQVMGLNVLKDFPAETITQFGRFYRKAKRKLSVQPYEAQVTTPAGRDTVQNGWLIPRVEDGKYNGMICSIQDVTAQKESEMSIQHERDRAQSYLELAEVMFVALDARGRITLVNRKGCEVLGRTEEELLGKSWFANCIPARMRKDVRAVAKRMFSGALEPVEYYENSVLTASGEERMIAWHNAVLRNDDGAIVGALSTGADITEQNKSRAELLKSEQRHKAVIAAIPDLMFVMDGKGTFLDYHAVDGQNLFMPPEAFMNKRVSAVMPKQFTEGLMPLVSAVLESGGAHTFGYSLPIAGKERFFEARIVPYADDQVLMIIRDLTEQTRAETALQKNEQQYRDLVENAGSIIMRMTSTGIVTYFNEYAQRFFGYPQKDIVGKNVVGTVFPGKEGDGRSLEWLPGAVANNPERYTNYEGPCVTRDGHRIYVAWAFKVSGTGSSTELLCIGNDITQMRKAQDERLRAALLWQATFDAMNEAICFISLTGIVMKANRGMTELLGLSIDDIVGVSCHNLFHNGGEPVEGCLMQKIRNGAKRAGTEIRLSGKWLQVTADPVNDDDGNMVGVVHIMSDITERKLALEALQEREEYLQSIYQAADNVSFITTDLLGKDTHVLDFSPGAEKIFGFAASDIVGKRIAPLHLSSDVKKFPEMQKELRKSGKGFSGEATLVRKSGERFPAMFTLHPKYDAAGTLVGTIGVTIDLTEQKRNETALVASEERYRSLFSNMTNGFALHRIITNRRGRPVDYEFIEINDAFEKMTGIKRNTALGRRVTEVLPGIGKDPADWIGTYGRVALEGGDYSFENYSEILDKWYSIHAYSPQKGLFATVVEDISERKTAEMKVLESEGRLRKLAAHLQTVREEERTAVAREIHDELGQLLTAFKMDVSWLERHLPQEWTDGDKKLRGMTELVDRVIGSVKRISANLRPSLLDDLGLYAAMEWQVDEFKRHTGLPCTFRINVSGTVHDDAFVTAVFRAFQEALTNVARHADATRVNASVTEKNGKLKIAVRDNGKGIDPERLQDPESYGLLGMRERVSAVGGTVSVKKRAKGGTEVVVVVPVKTANGR